MINHFFNMMIPSEASAYSACMMVCICVYGKIYPFQENRRIYSCDAYKILCTIVNNGVGDTSASKDMKNYVSIYSSRSPAARSSSA